uniref:Nitrogen fixation protein NifZ n=1 Tax=Candidatus Kentrum sp. FW TaxID=2126338 RepID=A0A450THU8_9GAMM|nr:MAG: nitrogen fixation protein NifZ [Candidatus Kentron sp. FW]
MHPKFEYNQAVRARRNLRNDGTYPGRPTGALLVGRGSVGYVRDVGSFLMDQLIYSVYFVVEDCMVGCREEELQPESEPWIESRFQAGDKVTPKIPLAIGGEIIVFPGIEGKVEDVSLDDSEKVVIQAKFNGRMLLVPDTALHFSSPRMDQGADLFPNKSESPAVDNGERSGYG